MSGDLETFHQAGDPRAIDVLHLCHVDKEMTSVLKASENLFPCLGREAEIDLARERDDGIGSFGSNRIFRRSVVCYGRLIPHRNHLLPSYLNLGGIGSGFYY